MWDPLARGGGFSIVKLVGLFYGYDFTVLRVFFTAGVVAMIGIIAFDHFGMIDISLIYINPTFLWSAIIGGLIMGMGFVVGGFCPGTSVCSAAIGKIDAMIFIAGSLFGVLVFAEGYPIFEGLYKSANWGNVRIFETLGMSQSLFAFLLTIAAVGAFIATSYIENRVNGTAKPKIKFTPYYTGLVAVALVLALSAFVLPERKSFVQEETNKESFIDLHNVKTMTADELAFRIMDDDVNLQIIDFRTQADFEKFHLPKSIFFTVDNLFEKEPGKILSYKGKINVFVADDEKNEKRFAVIAAELGFKNIKILKGGMPEFKTQILDFTPTEVAKNKVDKDTFANRPLTFPAASTPSACW